MSSKCIHRLTIPYSWTLSVYPKLSAGLIFFFIALGVTEPSKAQINGALFTTDYEREYLDAAREQYLAQQAAQGFDIEDSPPPIIADAEIVEEEAVIYHLGGVVTRQNGSRSVWLNNTLVQEMELPSGLSVSDTSELVIRHEGKIYTLRSGQVLNITTGAINESFQLARLIQASSERVETAVGENTQPVSEPSTALESSDDDDSESISNTELQAFGIDPQSENTESYLSELEALQANEEAAL